MFMLFVEHFYREKVNRQLRKNVQKITIKHWTNLAKVNQAYGSTKDGKKNLNVNITRKKILT